MLTKIEIKNHMLEYYFAGSGKDLLFIPGSLATYLFYKDFLDLLAKNFTVHCISIPGMGHSDKMKNSNTITSYAEIIEEFIKQKNIKPILLGQSIGGGIVLQICHDIPHLISKVVLFDPYYKLPSKIIPWTLIKGSIGAYYEYCKATKWKLVGKNLLPWNIRYMIFRRPRDVFKMGMLLKTTNLTPILSSIYNNVLILTGGKDSFLPVKYIEDLKNAIGESCELVILPNEGHNWVGYKPKLAYNYIKEFIK